MLIDIKLPPGQFANGTERQSAGRWRLASLVRWHDGTLQPVGGWEQHGPDTLSAKIRTMHGWRGNDGYRRYAAGSGTGLYAVNREKRIIDITPSGLLTGRVTAKQAIGYGVGPYGRGAYGSDYTPSVMRLNAALWTLDNWGEELIACLDSDGRIFKWSLDESSAATVIANAPTGCLGAIVTDQRFLMTLAPGGDGRKVQWSDRADYDTWTPSATNEAGDYDLVTTGQIVAARSFQGETLILTDADAHRATYVGPQLVYEFERVGAGCGLIGRNAVAAFDQGLVWMGEGGFHVYQGGQVQDLPCDVADYVFSDLSPFTRSHIYAVNNSEYAEIWWFYGSDGSEDNDRYVAWNYQLGTWMTGNLARTAGVDRGVYPKPVLAGTDLKLYDHERGTVPSGNPVFAQTGPIEVNSGEGVVTATRLYPDEDTQGEVTATFKTRQYPNATETSHGPYTMANPTPVRFTGRQVVMRVDGVLGADFRVGSQRLDVQPRGRR